MRASLPPLLALLVAAAATGAAASGEGRGRSAASGCPPQRLSAGYAARVERALRSGRDVWGSELIASPRGPTEEDARRYLTPLLLARGPRRTRLTASGVHYVAFSHPRGAQGAESVALHVADGSQILSQRIGGTALTISVGPGAGERYGSCLARLATPRLAGGYLPILRTRYVDSTGARYEQESFLARERATGSLASLVRLTVDARGSAARQVAVRFSSSGGPSARHAVRRGETRTLYAGWRVFPPPSRLEPVGQAEYEEARRAVVAYWERRLADGAQIVVPERRVVDAERSLLIQNLGLTWRYSLGNPYEQFSFPEGIDVAQVMAAYGFADVSAAILRTSLTRRPTPYPSWTMGEKLVGSALHYRLFRDRAFVERVTPVLAGYVATLGRQIGTSRTGLLPRERYSSDIPDSVYGLHSQAVAWQGLRWMGQAWEETGHRALAARCRSFAARLEAGLRRAIRASRRRLPDGSLFVPVRLLDPEPAYDSLVASRSGSYWNLVMPYALASGLFAPGSPEARGLLRYLLAHGSRLLGLVRAGAYSLYGRRATYPVSGTDQVYGLNVARFLADNDQADQLVLSLYGHLAAAMTPGTFVAGEAASVAPLIGDYFRAMYLPPNGAANGAFLETLRLTLVHETRGRDGRPRGLQLAYATPRDWLRPGRRIEVRSLPTSFGAISFSIERDGRWVRASLDVPGRGRLESLSIRLRLPRGNRITAVILDDRPYRRFDPRAETVDLPPRPGRLELAVRVGRG